MCTHCQGLLGHSQGCKGAAAGEFILIDIHGSYGHTLLVLNQGLATKGSYGLGLSFGTLLGVNCVVLQEAGLGIS